MMSDRWRNRLRSAQRSATYMAMGTFPVTMCGVNPADTIARSGRSSRDTLTPETSPACEK